MNFFTCDAIPHTPPPARALKTKSNTGWKLQPMDQRLVAPCDYTSGIVMETSNPFLSTCFRRDVLLHHLACMGSREIRSWSHVEFSEKCSQRSRHSDTDPLRAHPFEPPYRAPQAAPQIVRRMQGSRGGHLSASSNPAVRENKKHRQEDAMT